MSRGKVLSSGENVRYSAFYIWLIAAAAALGGLLFGYDWVVIGGAKPFYEQYFGLNSELLIGWANSCALLGCLIGSIIAGLASERYGRKKLLIWTAVLFAVSSVATGWAQDFQSFIAWRIVGGVAIGIASNVSPTYIAEISPAPWRGRLVALNQLAIVVGILAAQVANLLIAVPIGADPGAEAMRSSWNAQYGWRWMFSAVAVPSLIFLVSAFFIPESPRWQFFKGARDKARQTLQRIGGAAYAEATLKEMSGDLDNGVQKPAAPWRQLRTPAIMGVLVTGIGLAVLQQWSGINIIFNYAEEIYRGAGYGVSDVLFNIVITGAINLIFTLVALVFVDRFGRRSLMLFGCAAIAACHLVLGFAYATGVAGVAVLALTLSAIACYAVSLAPVTWVLIAEMFPNRVRGLGVSMSVCALWIASFALTFTFPIMNSMLGTAATFWAYGAICALGFVFVYFRVRETKGKTLEEIEREIVRAR